MGEEKGVKPQQKTHHHANLILLVAIDLNSVVNNQIHELIKPTKSPND